MKATEKSKGSRGYTLAEILVVLSIISLLATISVPPVQSFIDRLRFNGCLRRVSQLMRQGQIISRETYVPHRLYLENGDVVLQKKEDGSWSDTSYSCRAEPGILISANQCPVFYPSGAIVPLCTITLSQGMNRKYSLTISAAGRIRTDRLD